MTDVFKGIVAGGIAAGAISLLMLAQSAAGVLPQVSLIHLLLVLVEVPREHTFGWILHFVIGSLIWGSLFTSVELRLGTDSHTKAGILFGVILWLVVVLVFMPAAHEGYFGFQLARLAPLVMLALHVVYGAVLGWTYGKLSPTHDRFATHHPA
jgi:hypothetical protein